MLAVRLVGFRHRSLDVVDEPRLRQTIDGTWPAKNSRTRGGNPKATAAPTAAEALRCSIASARS